jgi:hypothetical protein
MKRLLSLAIAIVSLLASAAEAQRVRPVERPPEIARPPVVPGPRTAPDAVRGRPSDPIEAELQKPNPRPEVIQLQLKELASGPDGVPTAVVDRLAGLLVNQPTNIVAIEASKPNVLVRMPTNPSRRAIADFVVNQKLNYALSKQIDRETLILMPLLISSAAKLRAQQIEPGRQALRGVLGSITHGDFSMLDAHMFAGLRGKTLVVVGHVVEYAGKPAFEIRSNDARRYLPLDSLQKAAADVGFNLIPLGCETGEVFAVGTAAKITDVDGVEAFRRAISRSGRTSYRELLDDLASENMRLVIDPTTAKSNLIPIELIDRDGTSVQPPTRFASGPPSSRSPANYQPMNFLLEAGRFRPAICEISEAGLSLSILYRDALAICRRAFPLLLSILLAVFVLVASVETTLHERQRPSQTMAASATRLFVMRQTGNSKLMVSIYDALALAGALTIVVGVYGYLTVSWMVKVILDPGNFAMRDQPMNVFVFVMLLIPIVYLIAPYSVQRQMLRVPKWTLAVVACASAGLLLSQEGSIFFAVFGLAVTTLLVGLPLLLFRGTIDKNHKFSARLLLVIGCALVVVVIFGWSWSAASAGCLLDEPRSL